MKRYFVTGTDTEVGKTFIAAALLARAGGQGLRTSALKPVAAGARWDVGMQGERVLRNEDALLLADASNQSLPYRLINPFCFEPAVAPHLAAADIGESLSVQSILDACREGLTVSADFTLVEGAGGWRVPFNGSETFADLAKAMDLPVLLVVGMKLGCISHALLTAEAIRADGLTLAGWVANSPGVKMPKYRENLETLQGWLNAPLLGEVPPIAAGDYHKAADFLSLPA